MFNIQAMGMLLSIGNAINGTEIKAFQLDFLARASETKDPVHKVHFVVNSILFNLMNNEFFFHCINVNVVHSNPTLG